MIKVKMNTFVGDKEYLEKEYEKLTGKVDNAYSRKIVENNKGKYKAVFLVFAVILLVKICILSFGTSNKIVVDNEYVKSIIKPEKGVALLPLIAEVEGKGISLNKNVTIKVKGENVKGELELNESTNQIDESTYINIKLNQIISGIYNSNTNIVILPEEIEDGISVKWKEKKDADILIIVILMLIILGIIYANKYSKINKLKRESRISIYNELPEFVNRIVLMMNAGLVFSSAFERIVRNEEKNESHNYFNSQLINIAKKSQESNSSVVKEISEFAYRTQLREFIRISNIISDNMCKGSQLIEKLDQERDTLRDIHKKQIEELIKTGETKLSFPLAIQLIILITITISPAMIN